MLGPMEKFNIFIQVSFPEPNKFWDTASRSFSIYLYDSPNKAIIYTNFKLRASHEWLKFCENFLVEQDILGDCILLHGDTGQNLKSLLVE